MGLFDFFKGKPEPEAPKGTHQTPPSKEVPPPPPATEVSWSALPADLTDIWAEFAREHAYARARGLKMLAYSYEGWSPGSVAMRKFCKHPLALDVLRDWHVVEISLRAMDLLNESPEVKARGLVYANIPQLWTFDAQGRIEDDSVSGGIWGADTPENIAPALRKWLGNR